MILIITLLIISFLLVILLKFISFLISEKSLLLREEISSFECGFEHHNVSRVPFSLRYFFLTLIFLLFDLEIILILFFPSVIFCTNYFISFIILIVFLLILFMSLIYEWNDGTLEWIS